MTLSKNDKVLVLIIDLDDDLSLANIETPVVGYESVLKAGSSFGIVRPRDADLNAIFLGINAYNGFKSKGYDAEIAIVSGSREGGPEASIKVSKQLGYLKEKIGFTHIYLVSDSPQDETVIPLLNNYGRVMGIERAIVEQIRGVEETYHVLGKYLKKAFSEQPYAKFFLGVPGLLIFLYLVLSIMGLTGYTTWFSLLLVSVIMMTQGFGVVARIREYWKASVFSGVLISASTVLLIYALITAIFIVYLQGYTIQAIINVINLSTYPLSIALILLISSRVIYRISKSDPRVWVEAIYGVVTVFLIVYLVNLNSKIENIETSGGAGDLVELLSIDHAVLLIAVITVIAVTMFFLILEAIVTSTKK